jgi:hypothetical protein
MYSMAFRIPLDSAAAPHMVQITEITVIWFPPLLCYFHFTRERVPKSGHFFFQKNSSGVEPFPQRRSAPSFFKENLFSSRFSRCSLLTHAPFCGSIRLELFNFYCVALS